VSNHVADATQYAKQIVAGEIPACKWVRLACQRQLDDLQRERKKSFAYKFDAQHADKLCRFIELLPHIWKRST
jgi:phage terminase large subunit-like protein